MWKTILVPHDFSASAEAALRTAAELARVHRAMIVVLHVSNLPPNVPVDARIVPAAGADSVRLDEWVARGTSAKLEGVAAPLRAQGLEVATRARIGDIESEILAAALEDAASVIVMGTHGREGLAHVFLGSVAEKVVRRAPVPVVTVRTPGPETERTNEERAAEDELAG